MKGSIIPYNHQPREVLNTAQMSEHVWNSPCFPLFLDDFLHVFQVFVHVRCFVHFVPALYALDGEFFLSQVFGCCSLPKPATWTRWARSCFGSPGGRSWRIWVWGDSTHPSLDGLASGDFKWLQNGSLNLWIPKAFGMFFSWKYAACDDFRKTKASCFVLDFYVEGVSCVVV